MINHIPIANILLFLVYLYGFGHSLTRFFKNDNFENFVIKIGVGLGTLPLMGVILNLINIPLDWRIFLFLSLIFPSIDFICYLKKTRSFPSLRIPKKGTLILLGIFAMCFIIYCYGPFAYPWLENDDPWSHAASIKYLSVEKNLDIEQGVFQYLNPYPPGYQIIMGILHQTHPSLYLTLKFFNGYIIALGFLFFYYFAQELTQNNQKALLATFFLATIPCYLSHFIWAHSLAVVLFFPAFYTILRACKDNRYILPSSVIVSGIFLTQPTQSIKFTILFFIFFLVCSLMKKRIQKSILLIFVLSSLLSLTWWGPKLNEYRTGKMTLIAREGNLVTGSLTKTTEKFNRSLFDPKSGSATRPYSLNDYLTIPKHNLINNPIGIGHTLFILVILGIIICYHQIREGEKEDKMPACTILGWVVFTFLGMNSATFNLPVGLFAFRFWMLFAIPASFLAAETVIFLSLQMHSRMLRVLAIFILLSSILVTSGHSKFRLNTNVWPWGVYWHSREEISGYIWMRKNLASNSKVFAFTDNLFVIGNDMHADYWSKKYKKSFKGAVDFSPKELSSALKSNNFQYFVIDQRTIKKFGRDAIKRKIVTINKSDLFELIYNIRGAIWIYEAL